MNSIIKASGSYELALAASAEETKKVLLDRAFATPAIENDETQKSSFQTLADIKSWLKQVEESREQVKKPILETGRKIDRLAKEHCEKLIAAADWLQRILSVYHDSKQKRLEEEQKQKDEEIELQKRIEAEAKWEEEQAKRLLDRPDATEEDLQRAADAEQDRIQIEKQTIATMQQPIIRQTTKPAGMVVKKCVLWEVTDTQALYKAMPHFFRLEPVRSIINASISKTTVLPGLKVWEETVTTARAV